MAPPLLTLSNIHLTFGGTPLLAGAELNVGRGARICLVGRNGSGKSTLLKIAAGELEPDGGDVFRQPDATIRYLSQEPDFTGARTVRDFVVAGLAPGDDSRAADDMLETLGLGGDEDPNRLSGGERRRAALVRALAPHPDILMLDEPTNHLDLPAIEWLEGAIKRMKSAVIMISHDRRFLETLARSVTWLDRGETRRLEDGFAAFDEWRDAILEQEATERHKLNRKIHTEMQWLAKGVTARRKRNMGRLRALHDLRRQRREQRTHEGSVKITASDGAFSSKRVIDARGISKSFGGRKIVDDFSIRVLRGDRIGIVGPNGAGKTTLINMLTGALQPDSGGIDLSVSLKLATLDQSRESLAANMSLQDALTGGSGDSVTVGGEQRHVIGYMKDFLFDPAQARTAVSALSGGERGRLMVARAMTRPSNLLVLDEPTNDLDLDTLDLLQEMIADYEGTVILVSHDRDFLDRTATSTVNFEGDGRWLEYAGGFTDMMAERGGTRVAELHEGDETRKPRQSKSQAERRMPKKMSFKDKHALETLPDTIDSLEKEAEKLRALLADPDLYGRDPAGFDKASGALVRIETALETAEEEWLRLEMLRESLEG